MDSDPATPGLLQPVVVPKGPVLNQQAGVCPKTVPLSNPSLSPETDGLLGQAVFPESVLLGETAGAVPDLFSVEIDARPDKRIFYHLAVE